MYLTAHEEKRKRWLFLMFAGMAIFLKYNGHTLDSRQCNLPCCTIIKSIVSKKSISMVFKLKILLRY